MEPEKKRKTARIVAFVCFPLAILLLLDDIFFNFVSDGTLVPLAALIMMVGLLAMAAARKEEEAARGAEHTDERTGGGAADEEGEVPGRGS